MIVMAVVPAGLAAESTEGRFEHLRGGEIGMPFVSAFEPDHATGYLYRSGFACGAVVIGDVNADGWPDVFCTSGAGKNALFVNKGGGESGGGLRFEAITADSPGLDGGDRWSTGAAMADIDGDGDLDLYVCHYDAPNQVFLNDGAGRFEDRSGEWGADVTDASHSPALADYDGDGDLDLYLLTNRYEDPQGYRGGEAFEWVDGRPVVKPEFERYYLEWFEDADHWGIQPFGRADYLFRNDGGKFTDVTDEAGIEGRGDGLSATWWDFNDDGRPDLYVGNDFIGPDRLYQNNGDGTFTNVLGDVAPRSPWFSMGADAGDLDNDGFLDLLVADMSATNHFKQKTTMGVMGGDLLRRSQETSPPQFMRNTLLVGTGVGRFMEAGFLAGLDSSDWTWAVKFADLDNDGLQDVFLTNGTPRAMNDSDLTLDEEKVRGRHPWSIIKTFPERREPNRAYRNEGGLQFRDQSAGWALDYEGVSYAAASGDLDRDGDVDLVVLNVGEDVSVFRNDVKGGNSISVRLRGRDGGNRWGVGARVTAETGAVRQIRELFPDRGYMSGDEPVAHFGIGPAAKVDRLTVRWPSGAVSTLADLEAGRLHVVDEPAGGGRGGQESPDSSPVRPPVPLAMADPKLAPHSDPPFDDFSKQLLLPNKLSMLGPGAAWGDVDGDGDDDLYLGGGAGQRGELLLNDGKGRLAAEWVDAFRDDKAHEDMGAVFLDADSDGDLDLYVASGSYEFDKDADELRDRLYLNDGAGAFTRAPAEAIPDGRDAGSCVVAADYDRDGDLDLFVGSRVIPGEYPLSPASRLLRNDGGRFVEANREAGLGEGRLGLVTAALWSDADNDGWIDLLVACEWGPIQWWRNVEGRFEDATEASGLGTRSGWWNSLAGRDLDEDGDIDYVAGNTGLNTKYHHPSTKKPVLAFYGDYAGDGRSNFVEAKFEDGILYPVRGRSCSSAAMPHLREKFTSFRSFAQATLQEIYSPVKLDESEQYSVDTLESGIWWNGGDGRFHFEPLPHRAQISPIFGIACEDVDADGAPDIVAVQNFFGPQPETFAFDGGLGVVLRGDGRGVFEVMAPHESGLVVPGDATALAVADLDGDAAPDFLIARNADRPLLAATAAASPDSHGRLAVRLRGPAGNPAGVGARLRVVTSGDVAQTAEVTAGSGYLSQSAPVLFFGTGRQAVEGVRVDVRWPDGREQSVRGSEAINGVLEIAVPER